MALSADERLCAVDKWLDSFFLCLCSASNNWTNFPFAVFFPIMPKIEHIDTIVPYFSELTSSYFFDGMITMGVVALQLIRNEEERNNDWSLISTEWRLAIIVPLFLWTYFVLVFDGMVTMGIVALQLIHKKYTTIISLRKGSNEEEKEQWLVIDQHRMKVSNSTQYIVC